MQEIDLESKRKTEIESEFDRERKRLELLLQAVSRIFESHFELGLATDGYGVAIHAICVKLGIESKNQRNLITLYGRELDIYPESVRKVMFMINKGMHYKSLNSMVHAFAFNNSKMALAAFGQIVRLGIPDQRSVSGLLIAMKNNEELRDEALIIWVVDSVRSLMEQHRINLEPKIAGSIVDLYSSKGMMKHALKTLLEMPKIDDIGITSFLSGCLRHEDMESASIGVTYLEKRRVSYCLNESIIESFKKLRVGIHFGDNVMIEKKEVGRIWI